MRKILFILTAATTTIIIVIIFVFQIMPSRTGSPTNTGGIPNPTKTPLLNTITGKPTPPIKYDFNNLAEKAKNRQPLSQNGLATKQKLIASLNNASGVVYESSNIRIGYVAAPDLFQAKINSKDIEAAKTEAVNWMLLQGFTKDDLCKLPFSFYLGQAAADELIKTKAIFNPTPEGC